MKFESKDLILIRRRLAAHIQSGRKRNAWTQQMLTDRSQLPRAYIADLEGARRNPSLLRVSIALGVAIHELLREFLKTAGKALTV